MRGRSYLWGGLGLGLAFSLWMSWPLTSAEWALEWDAEQLQQRERYVAQPAQKAEAGLPNIVVIYADDLGLYDLSAYGGQYLPTPHIDSIGLRGLRFENAYTTAPICSPSRASLLTGRQQQRYGLELQPHDRYPRNRLEYAVFQHLLTYGGWRVASQGPFPRQEDIDKQGLPLSEITLAEILKQRGYQTAIIGKWHLGHLDPRLLPHRRGFDTHYGFYEAFTLYQADTASAEVVNQHHKEFTDKRIWGKGRSGSCAIVRNGEVIEEPEYLTFAITREAKAYITARREKPFFLYLPFNAPHTPFQAPRAYYDRLSHISDHNLRVYYAMVQALDDAVGQIVQALREAGLEKNTLLFFASDNGAASYAGISSAPLKAGKFSFFEGGIRVPLLCQWPAVLPAGRVFRSPVITTDVFATAVAAAQAKLPEGRVYDGIDLRPWLLQNRDTLPREALYWRTDYNRAIRYGDWKLIHNALTQSTLLYNLVQDPSEQQNLSAQEPALTARLMQMIADWEKDKVAPLWPRVMDFYFEVDGERHPFGI